MKTKSELRNQLKTAIDAISPEEKKRQSDLLCQRLLSDPSIQECKRLGIYLSLPDEPDLRPALSELLNSGIQLANPFPERNIDTLVCDPQLWSFHLIQNLEPKKAGPWDLDLPEAGNIVSASDLDVILVPGRGFTSAGNRIGRGKGIYDQLLAHSNTRKIGIAFSSQILKNLPFESHDVLMDEVWVENMISN